jgi:hypothetical protein
MFPRKLMISQTAHVARCRLIDNGIGRTAGNYKVGQRDAASKFSTDSQTYWYSDARFNGLGRSSENSRWTINRQNVILEETLQFASSQSPKM